MIKVKWSGQANVFWNEECGENVSFEAEVEAKVPSVPKVKVINGFKKTKLKIDKNTEIELLNFFGYGNGSRKVQGVISEK